MPSLIPRGPENPHGDTFDLTLTRQQWQDARTAARSELDRKRAELLAKGWHLPEPPDHPDPLGAPKYAIETVEEALSREGDPIMLTLTRSQASVLCGVPIFGTPVQTSFGPRVNPVFGILAQGPVVLPDAARRQVEEWMIRWEDFERSQIAKLD